jgi:magnesium chelatase family protein
VVTRMQVFSILTRGTDPGIVEIEFHSRFQIPSFQILGLPAPEIQEAKERIIAAFQGAGLEFPKRKVIINLAPASVKKTGTGHDLSIALKIISEISETNWPKLALAWGELSLEGLVKPAGKMAMLIEILLNQFQLELPLLFLTSEDFANLKLLLQWRKDFGLRIPLDLHVQVVNHLNVLAGALDPHPLELSQEIRPQKIYEIPPALLPLPKRAERVLKLSLIGKHHVLLLGPKGVGKSESIRWYQTLLPDSEPEQTWQRLLISEQRELPPHFKAPVRRVHAQVRPAHLLGTFQDRGYLPGELALAHGGLFIADEFLEWPRDSKECLREPLQTKKIFLTRIKGQIECPADFQMVATSNLCPCGGLPAAFRGSTPVKKFKCKCRPMDIEHYLRRISGPILDRIDLAFVMSDIESIPPDDQKILRLQQEIESGRRFALNHFGALPSELSPQWLEENLPRTPSIEKILADVTSLRSRHKIMRVARSIQALEGSKNLRDEYVFEAKWYRFTDTLELA